MAGTADPVFTPDTGNEWLDSIMWGTQWSSGATGGNPTQIVFYIAGLHGSEAVNLTGSSVTASTPYYEEIKAMTGAMDAMAAVANIQFFNTSTQAGADLIWASVDDVDAEGALGWANPPGTSYSTTYGDEQSLIVSNYQAYNPDFPDPDLLIPGGFDYITFIHELGHALGLAHPHDNGGGSEVAPGVTSPFGSYGDFDLNQGVYSMMSYNDGWQTGPAGAAPDPNGTYGYELGPMAFDIAALQIMYGANMNYRTGDDLYALPTANVAGTGYMCIWDAGGVDAILGGDFGNMIDLRAATLQTEEGGGGWISYAEGIAGGFTIANGVVIENATGGDGADVIIGNDAANKLLGLLGDDALHGGAGADVIRAGEGADFVEGGLGKDMLRGGDSDDIFYFGRLADSAVNAARDVLLDFIRGVDLIDVSDIDARAGGADDAFKLNKGGGFTVGEVHQSKSGKNILLEFNTEGDSAAEMSLLISGKAKLDAQDFIL